MSSYRQWKDGDGDGPPPREPTTRARLRRELARAATAPFADPDRLPVMFEALAPLLADGVHVRFSNHTGLVRTLRGPLWPGEAADSPEHALTISGRFVEARQLALFGAEGQHWREAPLPVVGSTACLRQVDPAGVPVYGARIAVDFDRAGMAGMAVANWYPQASSQGRWLARRPELAFELAQEEVWAWIARWNEANALWNGSDPPLQIGDLVSAPGDEVAGGLVLMPLFKQPGAFRLAWVVHVLDRQYGLSWEVIVNAEEDGDRILGIAPRFSEQQVTLYATSSAAVGGGQPRVTVESDAIQAALPNLSIQSSGSADLALSAWYHLGVAARIFEASAARAWSGPVAAAVALPGRPDGPMVHLDTAAAFSSYGPGTSASDPGTIHLRGGQRPHALDPEVVYHEYSHSVCDRLQHGLLEPNQPGNFRAGLNEGLGYYLACAISERTPGDVNAMRWADFAYGQGHEFELEREAGQQAGFDYLTGYGIFPPYTSAQLGTLFRDFDHAAGLIMARALWDMRRMVGYELTDSAILRALPMLGGIHTEFETAAETIIHCAVELLGGADPADETTLERALRLCFNSRGVTADGPVNDLQQVRVGQTTLALAAIEAARDQTGCLYSADGDRWSALGHHGSLEVSALSVVRLDEVNAVVLSAGATPGHDRAEVFRYDLHASAPSGALPNDLNLTDSWTRVGAVSELADQLADPGILSIAGAVDASGTLRVFVGTERGLFEHTGQAWWELMLIEGGANRLAQPITSLAAIQPGGTLTLIVGGATELFVIAPQSGSQQCARRQQFEQGARPRRPVLALAATSTGQGQPTDVSAWAATSFGRIYRFAGGAWANLGALPLGVLQREPPIYSLLADPAAGEPDAVVLGSAGSVWRLPRTSGTPQAYGDHLPGLAITAIAHAPTGGLLAGTLERGLWHLRPNMTWAPITAGLGRAGRQVDAVAARPGPWVHTWERTQILRKDEADALVFALPEPWPTLSLVDSDGTVSGSGGLALFYVRPVLDPESPLPQLAGLRRLLSQAATITNAEAGFYILCVVAQQDLPSFRLTISLA